MAPGKLIVVGSGIASISQLTLQAVAHIEQADLVCYTVADPATEAYILSKNPNTFDLYVFYGEGKVRTDSYIQMAEYMVQNVREGKVVVAVLYGHPGVFVSPTHRAIALARAEGFEAVMLPGVSAEDCLFADLGIDPSTYGLVTYEATDLLVRKRQLVPSSSLVLWQVGVVGRVDFKFHGYDNSHIDKLLDYLEPVYGANHPVTHYIAAVVPQDRTVIEKFTIAELRNPDVWRKIHAISTFYLPPKTTLPPDERVMNALGINTWQATPTYPFFAVGPVPYSPHDKELVSSMVSYSPPSDYRALVASSAMVDIMTRLSLDPKLFEEYKANPKIFASTRGLTADEQHALDTGNPQWVYYSMKDNKGIPFDQSPPATLGVLAAFIAVVVVAVAGG
jgi:precorrin-4 methylase